jgi:thioredoxin reductase (NADPH)
MNTTDVENYPGFPEGIMGPDLMENFEKQAARFGTEIQFEDVTSLDLDGTSRP